MNNMMASTYFDDQWLGMEAYKEWFLHASWWDRTSAKCKVCPITRNKIELSNMVKGQLKVMLKAKNFAIDLLYTFKVAVSSLRPYLKDRLSHLVHLLHLLFQALWINL